MLILHTQHCSIRNTFSVGGHSTLSLFTLGASEMTNFMHVINTEKKIATHKRLLFAFVKDESPAEESIKAC